jgi:hypothetical protein
VNLDTKAGMAAAVAWTNNCLSMLKDGGVGIVPRSGTQVRVLSYAKRSCMITCTLPDPTIQRVLLAAGWTVNGQAPKSAK